MASACVMSAADENGNSAAMRTLSVDGALMQADGARKRRLSFMQNGATNVTFQDHHVTREQRATILGKHTGFRGCTIWFTGLSGAGKTTIAFALESTLNDLGIPAYGLDGDNMRHGVCADLTFSGPHRTENVRRVAEVSKLFADMGVVCLASFISPFEQDREAARATHAAGSLPFVEVFVNTPLAVCEQRDVKGLYGKARAGVIRGFTGIDSPFEAPTRAEIELHTHKHSVAQCVQQVLEYLYDKGLLPERAAHELCGSPVRELFVAGDAHALAVARAATLPRVDIDTTAVQWMQVLAEGWATPLSGFMRERQYLQALHFGQLLDLKRACDVPSADGQTAEVGRDTEGEAYMPKEGVNQSVPILLPVDDAVKNAVANCRAVALFHDGECLAVLDDIEVFAHRKEERCHRQFACTDERHPAVAAVMQQGDWCLGGDLQVLRPIRYDDGLDEYRLTPAALRARFSEMGADAVFVFQLRNPVHNGHALLMRDTRDRMLRMGYKRPVLLLHPLGGWTKDDDVPLAVRMRQHRAVLDEGVLSPDWTVLAIFPSPMLYAGPTEVQWHARARLAAGVNFYIVGRDPAGIQKPGTGDYLYEPTHGAKVLSMARGLPNLGIIPFRVAAYDTTVGAMRFFDPARADDFLFISGTKMRAFARSGQRPPAGFMAERAWQVLADHYKSVAQ